MMAATRALPDSRNPDALWVTQQARNLSMAGVLENVRFLIRDRDSKFPAGCDRRPSRRRQQGDHGGVTEGSV